MNRFKLINNLISHGEGLHIITDEYERVYQGIVKNNAVLFYVTSVGVVYQNMGAGIFKEIGDLTDVEEFKIIARFNNWI